MGLTHLVDTSVLTRLGTPEVREVVEPLASAGMLARSGISDLEIGYSARNQPEWDRLIGALDVFTLVEIDTNHFRRARDVQRLLAARSQRGRKIPDLLLAAAAEDANLAVLHYDTDFDLIATATGQRCEWVVAAGTID